MAVRLLLPITLALAAGCGGGIPHPHGSTPFVHSEESRVLGCVTVGWEVFWQDDDLPPRSVLLQLSLRNSCTRPAPVDFSAMRITAYGADGAEYGVRPYDPRHEIGLEAIDAETADLENIQLDVAGPIDTVRKICFDVSRISPDAMRAAPAPACVTGPAPTSEEDGGT
jgi:hypothetical protein